MAQQNMTAVDWLWDILTTSFWDYKTFEEQEEIIEQAKQMEKEQIMMAIKDSWYMAKGSNFQEPQEEQYYKETYGKK